MTLIDSHAHLFWDEFQQDLEAVLERAKMAGVEKIIVPGLDLNTSQKAIGLAKRYPKMIKAAAGLHPEESLNLSLDRIEEKVSDLRKILQIEKGVVAIGEVGMDQHTEELKQTLEIQKGIFEAMINLAKEYNLPLIIHSRESIKEILDLIDKNDWFRGVFHCFSGNEAELREVIKRSFKVSFCGNITWSKRVAKLVKLVPNESLLLETDSPFMAPRDRRGLVIDSLRNEPKSVRILAERYAQLRGVELETIAMTTTENAKLLFRL